MSLFSFGLGSSRKPLARAKRPLVVELLEDRTLLNGQMAPPLPLPTPFPALQIDPQAYDATSVLVRFQPGTVQTGQLLAPGVQVGSALSLVDGLYRVDLQAGIGVQDTVASLQTRAGVIYAQPNYLVHTYVTPNDPMYGQQYALHNTGQTGGAADADIDGPEAWDTFTGSSSQVVAVIDTGVDYNHPDLAANMWTNPGETPNNGVDDDGNGFIDDVYGYDFANGDGNPMDDFGHGTHVAGTIGAVTNNNVGIAGVAWNVKIMAVKFLGADGSGSLDAAISALNYAVANGATISNNSWGGGPFYGALYDAIAAAGSQGHIFVAAAGNSANNNDANPSYPATFELDNIISVAATDDNDQLASFSNYGATTVDLGAPGVDILSTVPTSGELSDPSGYRSLSGTSMATPHVAGVVALVRGQHPEWTFRQVINQVLGTVDPVPSLAAITVTGGRLNAANAVGQAAIVKGPRVSDASPNDVIGPPVSSARITFNKSVDPATFTAADVASFAGPLGTISVTGVTVVSGSDNRQFDLSFASQSEFGNYDMVIGPDIRDVEGNWMNQDNDNVNGESTEDQYRLHFSINDHVVVASTDVPKTFAFNWAVISQLHVDADFTIGDVNVTLDITHPNTSEVWVALGHFTGASVLLVANAGQGANFQNTTFDDQASQRILDGASPFTGSYRPIDQLGILNGRPTKGDWALMLLSSGATGTLNSWSLTISASGSFGPGEPPPPGGEPPPGTEPPPPGTEPPPPGTEPPPPGTEPPPPGTEPPPPGTEPPPPGTEPPPPGTEPPPPGTEPPPPGTEPPPPGTEPPPPGTEPPPPGTEPPPPGTEPPPPVNQPPVANDDLAETDEDVPVTINVLANDVDPEGQPLTVSIVASSGGIAQVQPDQTVTFTPAPDYSGSASFTYSISDGQFEAFADVSITINPVNDAPIAEADYAMTDEDVPVTIDVLANDNDSDGDLLTVSIIGSLGGTAEVQPDQTVTFTPSPNYSGNASFTYSISDGSADAAAVVSIWVSPVNDAPSAGHDTATAAEDVGVTINVRGNDSDPDGDFLSVVSIDWTSRGTAVINPDQTVTFTPDSNYHGNAFFGYTISDGFLTASAVATITVTPVNDAPVAANDSASAYRDVPLSIASSALTANDTDIEGDSLQVIGVGNPSNGTVALQGSTIVFTPALGFSGWAGFDYVVSDGQATSAAHVDVDVRAVSYLSTGGAGTLLNSDGSGLAVANADIVKLVVSAAGTRSYQMLFDGSDVGLSTAGENVDAFVFLTDGSIVISPSGSYSVPVSGGTLSGAGEDLLRFAPTTLGDNTSGTWSVYFDGSDVGLSATTAENIDAVGLLPDGRILISTAGAFSVPGVGTGGVGQDLIAFLPTSLGATTSGTWAMYLDGSDVGLGAASENVDGLFVKPSTTGGLPTLYLSTTGSFAVPGVAGGREDAFAFKPTSTGWTSAGTFGPGLALDGSAVGLGAFNVDGIYLAVAPGQAGAASSGGAARASAVAATGSGIFATAPASPAPSTLVPFYPALTPATVSAVLGASPSKASALVSANTWEAIGIAAAGLWDWLDDELINIGID